MLPEDNSTNVTRMASAIRQSIQDFEFLMTQTMPKLVIALFLATCLLLGIGSLLVRIWIVQYNMNTKKKANPKNLKTLPSSMRQFIHIFTALVVLLFSIGVLATLFMIFGWVLILLKNSFVCC